LHVISLVAVHHRVHVGLGQGRINQEGRITGGSERIISPRGNDLGVSKRVKREVSPDVMGGRIRPDHVFETAVVDLEIVLGITPATNAVRRSIEEGRIAKVMCVCVKLIRLADEDAKSILNAQSHT